MPTWSRPARLSGDVAVVRTEFATPGEPIRVIDPDPVGLDAFRRRLLLAVIVAAFTVTLSSGYLAYRLSQHTAAEREASVLAEQLLAAVYLTEDGVDPEVASLSLPRAADSHLVAWAIEGGARSSTPANQAEHPGHTETPYRRQTRDGRLLLWGYEREPDVEIWAELRHEGRVVAWVEHSIGWEGTRIRTEALARAAIGSGVIAWFALWVGFMLISSVSRRLARSSHQLLKLATRDALTRLPNRVFLESRLAATLACHDARSGWVAIVGIHNLRTINETLGHHIGDRVLTEIADRLMAVVGDAGEVARFSDDEFAIWLPGTAEGQALVLTAEAQAALGRSVHIDDLDLQVASTVGLCDYPGRATTAAQLLSRADVAMTMAHRENRGPTVYESGFDADSRDQLALRSDLRDAIDAGTITLHYQPKIDVATGRWVGVEALARWHHRVRGWVPPPAFIEAAELSGMIHELTYVLLSIAVRQADRLARLGVRCPIAVNLSASTLADPAFPDVLESLLRSRGLTSDALELELTEGVAIAAHTRARSSLERLSGAGVRIAIDDFGTGMSSLSYLRELPIRYVKIDRSFVRNLGLDANAVDRRIVRSVINLSHDLSLSVIAEGVEDQATLDALAALGCDEAQGYLVARPMPGEALEAEIRSRGVVLRSPPVGDPESLEVSS